MRIAVYPGSFDPITNGHLDVVRRAAARVRPGRRRGARQPAQGAAARRGQRVAVIRAALDAEPALAGAVDVADVRRPDRRRSATEVGAGFLVRGLRAIADFESELQLAHNNHQLAPDVDTVFFMTSLEHSLRQLEPGQGDRPVRRRRVARCCPRRGGRRRCADALPPR